MNRCLITFIIVFCSAIPHPANAQNSAIKIMISQSDGEYFNKMQDLVRSARRDFMAVSLLEVAKNDVEQKILNHKDFDVILATTTALCASRATPAANPGRSPDSSVALLGSARESATKLEDPRVGIHGKPSPTTALAGKYLARCVYRHGSNLDVEKRFAGQGLLVLGGIINYENINNYQIAVMVANLRFMQNNKIITEELYGFMNTYFETIAQSTRASNGLCQTGLQGSGPHVSAGHQDLDVPAHASPGHAQLCDLLQSLRPERLRGPASDLDHPMTPRVPLLRRSAGWEE